MITHNPHTLAQPLPDHIEANQPDLFLASIPDTVKLISFDCFDTLLWRKAAEPTDVFYAVAQHPVGKKYGVNALMRSFYESQMTKYKQVHTSVSQVTLAEIYQHMFPKLTNEAIQELCQAEIEVELQFCFAYPPMIQLMRTLLERNYPVIIVSDTYLSNSQLTQLLAAKLPADILTRIRHIYCSSDHLTSKSENLFPIVCQHQSLQAHEVLHIGDNYLADVTRPRQLGLHTLHFQQFNQTTAEHIRMQPLAACFVDTHIRSTKSLTIPFKGLWAATNHPESSPQHIGYTVMGPILFAFAQYIIQSYQELNKSKSRVHLAYLLRDTYLPARACEAIDPTLPGKLIHISRFTSFAASFRTQHDIDMYLIHSIESGRYKDICRQLLLPESNMHEALTLVAQSSTPKETFIAYVHQPHIAQMIFLASQHYRQRFYRYLKNNFDLQPGDTLMLVDLGYTGSAQLCITNVFKEELGVDVVGHYFISLSSMQEYMQKGGLLDKQHYDDKALTMLVTYIALFEQLCTNGEKSVIDFDESGNPITSDTTVDSAQISQIKLIQEAAIQCVQDAKQFVHENPLLLNAADYRDLAAINLTRLIYLPTQYENSLFSSFKHDVNLGTSDVVHLMDTKKGLHGLRRRGWLHSLHESFTLSRMNYPSEWRSIALELSVLLMAQHRFKFAVAENDMSHQRIKIPVILQSGNHATEIQLNALPSYEGYFSLEIPIPQGGRVGIQFAKVFKCLELYQIEQIPLQHLKSKMEASHTLPVNEDLIIDQMTLHHERLLMAESEEGMLIFNSKQLVTEQMILRVLFRGIA